MKTAVHAGDILAGALLFPTLEEATDDLHFVAASTAKRRKIETIVDWDEAADGSAACRREPGGSPVRKRTDGLDRRELRRANLIFTIPQAARQPSYNLAAAVLLTLFTPLTEPGKRGPRRRPAAKTLERPAFPGGSRTRQSAGSSPSSPPAASSTGRTGIMSPPGFMIISAGRR